MFIFSNCTACCQSHTHSLMTRYELKHVLRLRLGSCQHVPEGFLMVDYISELALLTALTPLNKWSPLYYFFWLGKLLLLCSILPSLIYSQRVLWHWDDYLPVATCSGFWYDGDVYTTHIRL